MAARKNPPRTKASEARNARYFPPAARRLGRRIRLLRTERGLSQEKLSEAARITAVMLSFIETGRTNPSLATLLGLSRGLKVTLSELFEDV